MRFDIGEYVDGAFSDSKSIGDERVASCPECGKAGHWYINVESGSYVCFKCTFRGRGFSGIVKLVMLVEGMDENNATRLILKKSDINIKRKKGIKEMAEEVETRLKPPEEAAPELVDVPLPDEFTPVYDGKRWRFPLYLKERGISKTVAAKRGLGFCNKGRYQNRVIVPVSCPNGSAFTARDCGDHPIRYLNPRGVDFGRLLFGWDESKAAGDIILVEGPFDELMMEQHGIPSLGLGGKALKADQLSLLCRRSSGSRITLLLDPEEFTAPLVVARQLMCHFNTVHISRLPEGTDPGSSSREQAESALGSSELFRGELTGIAHAKLNQARNRLDKIYQ